MPYRTLVRGALAALLCLSVLAGAPPARAAGFELDLLFSTGGTDGEALKGLAVGPSGDMYIVADFDNLTRVSSLAGGASTELRARGGRDAFVARYTQTGLLLWAAQIGGFGPDDIEGVAVDPGGHVYVAGSFSGRALFSSASTSGLPSRSQILGPTVNSIANQAFIARYRPDGTLDWAAHGSTAQFARAQDVAVDAQGNAYIAGQFRGSVTWHDAGTPVSDGVDQEGEGSADAFLVQYRPDGRRGFVRGSVSPAFTIANDVAVDAEGNIFVTGLFQGRAEFRAGSATRTIEGDTSHSDLFAARYSPSGELPWLIRRGGAFGDSGSSIAAGPGGVYIAGVTADALGADQDASGSDRQGLVLRLAAATGASRGLAIASTAQPGQVAIGPGGDLFYTSSYPGESALGRDAATRLALPSRGGGETVFVAALSADLTPRFALTTGGGGARHSGSHLGFDAAGRAYLGGSFIGELSIGDERESSSDNESIFLAHFRLGAAPAPDQPQGVFYLSSTSGGTVGALSFSDEDLLAFDPQSGRYSMLIDGSDIGLGPVDVDAFHWMDDNTVLISTNEPATLPGLGEVDDSDIVRFFPTRLGGRTAGRYELLLDGSDVGLTSDAEDVDGVALDQRGDLVVSLQGSGSVPSLGFELIVEPTDLTVFRSSQLGPITRGFWLQFGDAHFFGLDGADERIASLGIDPASGAIQISTVGRFTALGGLSGDAADIFACSLSSGQAPSCAARALFDGSAAGFGGEQIDAFAVGLRGVLGEVDGETEPVEGPEADDERGDNLFELFLPGLRR